MLMEFSAESTGDYLDGTCSVYIVLAIVAALLLLSRHHVKIVCNDVIEWMLCKHLKYVNKHYFKSYRHTLFSFMNNFKDLKSINALEIGAGGGTNFNFYPHGLKITCLDLKYKDFTIKDSSVNSNVDITAFIEGCAEDMSMIEDLSFDVVISTLVLCSVKDTKQALREIKRVLKHNGKYYFMEHQSAERRSCLYYIQRLVNPFWLKLTGQCQFIKFISEDIHEAGFGSVYLQHFNAGSYIFPFINPCCLGIATK